MMNYTVETIQLFPQFKKFLSTEIKNEQDAINYAQNVVAQNEESKKVYCIVWLGNCIKSHVIQK